MSTPNSDSVRLQLVELGSTSPLAEAPAADSSWRTPPLSELPKYPVVAAVGAAALAVTVGNWMGWNCDPLLMNGRAWDGEVWRLASAALPHIGVLHLAFNLYWLWVFGTAIESRQGRLPTLGILLFFAVVTEAAQYAISEPGVGLSGVGYGLFGLLLVIAKKESRYVSVMNSRIVILFLGWLVFCWAMTELGHWRVGNVAHASGAIVGVLLGLLLVVSPRWRLLPAGALAAGTIAAMALAMHRTPSATELAYLGYRDLEAGRDRQAEERFALAVERDPNQADLWLNLGIARQRVRNFDGAIEAFRRASSLRPQDQELRGALASALAEHGIQRHRAGDINQAIVLYEESLVIDDRAAVIWYNLGLARLEVGRMPSAREALTRALQLDPSDKRFRDALELLPKMEG